MGPAALPAQASPQAPTKPLPSPPPPQPNWLKTNFLSILLESPMTSSFVRWSGGYTRLRISSIAESRAGCGRSLARGVESPVQLIKAQCRPTSGMMPATPLDQCLSAGGILAGLTTSGAKSHSASKLARDAGTGAAPQRGNRWV